MKRWLYLPALTIAALSALTAAAWPISEAVRTTLARPMLYAAAGTALLLFLRILLDPKCRNGILAANNRLPPGKPSRLRWAGLRDPQWGLFAARFGSRPLLAIRAILFAEFILALVSTRPGSDVLLLAFAGFGVATMLSLINIALDTPAGT